MQFQLIWYLVVCNYIFIIFFPESWGFYVYLNWLVIHLVSNPWVGLWKIVKKNWVYCHSFYQLVFWYFQVFAILLKKVILIDTYGYICCLYIFRNSTLTLVLTQKYLFSCRWRGYKIYQYTSLILVGCYNNDYSWLWRYCTNNTFWQIDRYIQITLCKDTLILPAIILKNYLLPRFSLKAAWADHGCSSGSSSFELENHGRDYFHKVCSTIQYGFIQCVHKYTFLSNHPSIDRFY